MDVKVFKKQELIATIPVENMISVCDYSKNRIAVNYKSTNTNKIIVCDTIFFNK